MLVELSIRDLALIERAELALGAGLDVVTGETGAGKSLLVGSLELLLGETPRGGAGAWVRKGAKEARIEGRFVLGEPDLAERVAAHLAGQLPEIAAAFEESRAAGEPELILGRSLGADGRTRAHVDQRPVTLRALRELAPLLLEIHGQNEHQLLLQPLEQLRLVDTFGRHGRALADYRAARLAWLELLARRRRLEAERGERRDRLDLLRFQREELGRADLRPGEHADLQEERALLRHAGELLRELGGLVEGLREAEGAVLERLQAAAHVLGRWSAAVPRLGAPLGDLESARVHVEEAASALASVLDGVEHDPARLEALEERLAELERLETKYAADEAGLLERLEHVAAEIQALEATEESAGALEDELAEAGRRLEAAAAALSRKRRALAPELARRVQETLAALGLARARLELAFEPLAGAEPEERFGPHGAERVELLLSANAGEPVRPLRHVASGGEAARIMLALRTVLSAADRGRTLVFDEIDAGVGGRLGPAVAAHLRALAEHHQVLCVTHLPAIAAQAHVHLRASKEVRAGRTRTSVRALAGEERVAEVADMIAGGAAHESARAEARRLLGSA